jgi:hypothetical protein
MRSLFGITAFVGLVVIALASCSDDADPAKPVSEEFSFNLSVKDTAGAPVADLEVGAWTFLSLGWPGPTVAVAGSSSGLAAAATTTINYVLARESTVDFDIFDLKGGLVSKLFSAQRQPSGVYTLAWSASEQIPNGVYQYRVTARDTLTGAVLFQDTEYAVLSRTEPKNHVIGYTGVNGSFTTRNELLFPGHFDLPTMSATNAQGSEIATFEVIDTVRITVVDTVNMVGLTADHFVGSGRNDVTLVWKSPVPVQSIGVVSHLRSTDPPHEGPSKSDGGPLTWSLRQNYPNPFW